MGEVIPRTVILLKYPLNSLVSISTENSLRQLYGSLREQKGPTQKFKRDHSLGRGMERGQHPVAGEHRAGRRLNGWPTLHQVGATQLTLEYAPDEDSGKGL
jgi:hypothetical protein